MRVLILGPASRNARIIAFLAERGCETRCTETMPDAAAFDAWTPDYLISNGFAPIIREQVLARFPARVVNIHPAYLPGGRGIFPNFWCFLRGSKVGVTIHLIDAGIDTGAILARKEVHFDAAETLATSYGRLLDEAEALFMATWDDFVAGGVAGTPQEEDDNPYHSRTESERLIDLLPEAWNTPVGTVREMGLEIAASAAFWDVYSERTEG